MFLGTNGGGEFALRVSNFGFGFNLDGLLSPALDNLWPGDFEDGDRSRDIDFSFYFSFLCFFTAIKGSVIFTIEFSIDLTMLFSSS